MSAKALSTPKGLDEANGTGPYRFVSRDTQATVLEANPDYWEPGKPHVKTIAYRTITDQTARIDALRTGEVDLVVEPGPAQVAQFKGNAKFYMPPPSAYTPAQYVYVLSQRGPFKDVRLRQAAAWAVDREAIAKSILRGI